MTPALSLVTGTLDRPDGLQRLAESVIENTKLSWELIVSDASDVPSVPIHPNIRILHEKPRLGYVLGYNRAFLECQGKWVIYLNDDAVVLPGYDQACVSFMESNPRIGLGCIAFSDRCWTGFEVQTFWGMIYANFGILDREFGNKLGWFWPELRMYGSDNALTFDVLLAGKGVASIHGKHIHHYRTDDQARKDNQVGRDKDSQKLSARYGPQRDQLKKLARMYEPVPAL